jgi:hypothetical protein
MICEVGSIVRKSDGQPLRSGCQAYGGATVVSLDPFVLVSECADMRWGSLKQDEFDVVAKSSPDQLALAMTRL